MVDAAEIIVWEDNRARLVDPNIHTNFQKFTTDKERVFGEGIDHEDLGRISLQEYTEAEMTIPTQEEWGNLVNKMEEEDFTNFEQDYASAIAFEMTKIENESSSIYEKYTPEVQEKAMGEFQFALSQIEPNYLNDLTNLQQKYENEINTKFPNGVTDEDLAKYNKKFLKEKTALYNKHYATVEQSITERMKELFLEIPEITELEAKQRKEFQEWYGREFEKYIDSKSGVYNKWGKETLDEIANNADLEILFFA